MNELDLLVENYFTDSFEASDLFRLVEQVIGEQKDFSFPHQQVASLMRKRFDDDTFRLLFLKEIQERLLFAFLHLTE